MQLFDHLPIWLVFIATAVVFLVAVEFGFRIGLYKFARRDSGQKSQVGTIMGASLALLAFFMAFTFGMASSRQDTRKSLVLEEANAVETTYLRAGLLPEPYRTEVQGLLREYVEIRAKAKVEPEILKYTIKRSEELHGMLWSEVVALTESTPTTVVSGLFIQSLNEMLDLHEKRLAAAIHNRIPLTIFITLYFVAFLSMAMMGYQAGLTGKRAPIASLALILVLSAVMILIIDLERPAQSVFNVSQRAMIELSAKINPQS
jgi:hypothetical protein